MAKHSGKCHLDCNHNHRHSAECAHGTPTAVPRARTCPVCVQPIQNPWYCNAHKRWECASHDELTHADGSWVALTRQTMAKQAARGGQRA